MMRLACTLAVMLLLPAGADAQQGRVQGAGSPQPGAMAARRAALEARVLERFMEQATEEMSLTAEQTERLGRLFRRNVERRRESADGAMEARLRLLAALRSPETGDAEFARRFEELRALRDRDHSNWLEEQDSLAAVLTPRQRAQFLARWLMLQENIRDVMARRRPPR